MKQVDLMYAFGLPPERAIEYFKSKGYQITFDWQEMLDQAHDRAFTVAKAMKLDILQDLRNAVQGAIDNGQTFQEFRRDLEPTLRSKGWWGRKEVLNDATGELREAQLGSVRRLSLIYEQNVQTAYSAGRYRSQAGDVKNRPYWMYVAVLDARTRASHAALNGQIFRHDDPIWQSFYPPLDWRCRCRVRALDHQDAVGKSEAGTAIWNESGSGKNLGSREEQLKDGLTATVATYKTKDPVTGKAITVATGPGFNHNPGATGWSPDPNRYDPELRRHL